MVLCAVGATEIIMIAIVILLIFGGKKIPELMRGIGQGVSQFKKGMREVESSSSDEDKKHSSNSEYEDYMKREQLKERIIKEKEAEASAVFESKVDEGN